jgi:hypothetical protein
VRNRVCWRSSAIGMTSVTSNGIPSIARLTSRDDEFREVKLGFG